MVQLPAIHGWRAAFNCASAQIQAKLPNEQVELLIASTRHVSWQVSIELLIEEGNIQHSLGGHP